MITRRYTILFIKSLENISFGHSCGFVYVYFSLQYQLLPFNDLDSTIQEQLVKYMTPMRFIFLIKVLNDLQNNLQVRACIRPMAKHKTDRTGN